MGNLLTRRPQTIVYHPKGRFISGIRPYKSTNQVLEHSWVDTHCKLFTENSQPEGEQPVFGMAPLPSRHYGRNVYGWTVDATYGTHKGKIDGSDSMPWCNYPLRVHKYVPCRCLIRSTSIYDSGRVVRVPSSNKCGHDPPGGERTRVQVHGSGKIIPTGHILGGGT